MRIDVQSNGWKDLGHHINELHCLFSLIRWLSRSRKNRRQRVAILVDSLVVLGGGDKGSQLQPPPQLHLTPSQRLQLSSAWCPCFGNVTREMDPCGRTGPTRKGGSHRDHDGCTFEGGDEAKWEEKVEVEGQEKEGFISGVVGVSGNRKKVRAVCLESFLVA